VIEKTQVETLAGEHGYRTRRQEDGEVVIACARGFLCEGEPPARLAWCVIYPADAKPNAKLKNAMKRDPKLRLEVEGDEEFVASFAVEDLAWVAERWAKVKKRRRLSPERKAAEAERLRAFRFRRGPRPGAPNEPCFASAGPGEASGTDPAPGSETAPGNPTSTGRDAESLPTRRLPPSFPAERSA
jgi:hypothetical protein